MNKFAHIRLCPDIKFHYRCAELRIEELFRPHVNQQPIFAASGADPGGLYSAQAAAEVAVRYAQQVRSVHIP